MGDEKSYFSRNIVTCHACRWRESGCRGACACRKDGRDIIEHARLHDCPEERFGRRGLGDLVAWALHWTGIAWLVMEVMRVRGKSAAGCGCARRRERLNGWGKVRDRRAR